MTDGYTMRRIQFRDKMEKHKFTAEQMRQADLQAHIGLKRMYGLEYLDFYEDKRGRYCCKYISDPNVFNYDAAMNNSELTFLLTALSIQQGKVFFEDYQKHCVGIDGLNTLYLPMKLSGL